MVHFSREIICSESNFCSWCICNLWKGAKQHLALSLSSLTLPPKRWGAKITISGSFLARQPANPFSQACKSIFSSMQIHFTPAELFSCRPILVSEWIDRQREMRSQRRKNAHFCTVDLLGSWPSNLAVRIKVWIRFIIWTGGQPSETGVSLQNLINWYWNWYWIFL